MAFPVGNLAGAATVAQGFSTKPKRVHFISQDTQKNIFEIDATVKEVHSKKATPSEFPIEDGTSVSDHILKKPFSLSITGIMSDTPLHTADQLTQVLSSVLTQKLLPPVGIVGSSFVKSYLTANSISESVTPSVAAYLQLLQLQDAGIPVNVVTTLKRYDGMFIEDISVPRDATNGNSIVFDITLVQLIVVQPQSVNIKIFADPALASSLAEMGHQSADAAGFPAGVKAAIADTTNAVSGMKAAIGSVAGG